MPTDIREATNAGVLADVIDIEYMIEIATQTLDRNIGFIESCDKKTSIVLTVFGALLALILANKGFNEVFDIIKACVTTKTFCSVLYLFCFSGSIFVMAFGMFKLGCVLTAQTSEKSLGRQESNSCIFFSGIKNNGNHNSYKQKFCSMKKKDILNDLIEQIYINADIASIKYATYNLGLRCMIRGFACFIVTLLIGVYIY